MDVHIYIYRYIPMIVYEKIHIHSCMHDAYIHAYIPTYLHSYTNRHTATWNEVPVLNTFALYGLAVWAVGTV